MWKTTWWWFQICFIFTPTWGNDPIDIFQTGGNHQLDKIFFFSSRPVILGGAKKLGVISFPTKLMSFLEPQNVPNHSVVIVLVFLEALILMLEEKRTQRLQITLPKTNIAP